MRANKEPPETNWRFPIAPLGDLQLLARVNSAGEQREPLEQTVFDELAATSERLRVFP